jgi:hypothetical protein
MINTINKERRRPMSATPTRTSNKDQRPEAQEDPKQKQDRSQGKARTGQVISRMFGYSTVYRRAYMISHFRHYLHKTNHLSVYNTSLEAYNYLNHTPDWRLSIVVFNSRYFLQ